MVPSISGGGAQHENCSIYLRRATRLAAKLVADEDSVRLVNIKQGIKYKLNNIQIMYKLQQYSSRVMWVTPRPLIMPDRRIAAFPYAGWSAHSILTFFKRGSIFYVVGGHLWNPS